MQTRLDSEHSVSPRHNTQVVRKAQTPLFWNNRFCTDKLQRSGAQLLLASGKIAGFRHSVKTICRQPCFPRVPGQWLRLKSWLASGLSWRASLSASLTASRHDQACIRPSTLLRLAVTPGGSAPVGGQPPSQWPQTRPDGSRCHQMPLQMHKIPTLQSRVSQ